MYDESELGGTSTTESMLLVKSVTAAVFDKLLGNRSKNNEFKNLEFVQTCVRRMNDVDSVKSTGVGQLIKYDFEAPINKATKEIQYLDKYAFIDELKMLKEKKFKEYARQQCLKMCQFVKRKRGIEILSMKAEFLKDDLHNVWFSYARQIIYRKSKQASSSTDLEGGLNTEQKKNLLANQQQELQEELENFNAY